VKSRHLGGVAAAARAQAGTPGTDTTAIAPPEPNRAHDQPTLILERWELVATTDDDALLRLAGRWHPAPPARVELVRATADAIDAIAPLPPGATLADDGTWSVAFAIDAEATVRDRLILWSGGGQGVPLPAPVRPATPLVGTVQKGQAAERAQLEHELARTATVEADLRHLLDARERELAQLRSELGEQRARYATAAGELPVEEAVAPAAGPDEKPWSRADRELLDRIARAKALAGQ
jgi:hypothetical protein